MSDEQRGTGRSPLPYSSEWSFDLIREYHREIRRVAEGFKLDTYPNQIEIITSEQMMDAYASVGMPVNYRHWSFGKHFIATEKRYKRGQMGLAYEIVINSNPCIAYLMEENTMMMQALVIAHAAYGHNSFFKGNYLFRQWTDAEAIIDYLVFARDYIAECEQKYGALEVEKMLDSCHALMNVGVDRYKRPAKISMAKEKERRQARAEYEQSRVNVLWRTIPQGSRGEGGEAVNGNERFPKEPQENLLYFIEKNAPFMESWQREIVRIVRKIAQYFYPQRQTQVTNEGWACFWHHTIINTLYDEGLLSDSFMLPFFESHTNVTYQPPYNSPHYSGINPYALGFAMWTDIKRICEAPTEEDRRWFPEIAGSDWRETFDFAMRAFKDESFIQQYLSPKLIRDLRLFSVYDDDRQKMLRISDIHDEDGYREVRENLSSMYNLADREPDIQVWNVDREGDRTLTLRYTPKHRHALKEDSVKKVLFHVARLWGYPVTLESHDPKTDETTTIDKVTHVHRKPKK